MNKQTCHKSSFAYLAKFITQAIQLRGEFKLRRTQTFRKSASEGTLKKSSEQVAYSKPAQGSENIELCMKRSYNFTTKQTGACKIYARIS